MTLASDLAEAMKLKLPSGMRVLNDVKTFPKGRMRYEIFVIDKSQSPSKDSAGTVDSVEQAIATIKKEYGSHNADAIRVFDRTRGFPVLAQEF